MKVVINMRLYFRANNQKLLIVFMYIVSFSTLFCITYYFLLNESYWIPPRHHHLDRAIKNYFLEAGNLKSLGLVVNTTTCKIPDFQPWDSALVPLVRKAEPLEECRKTHFNWTRVDSNILVMNFKRMQYDGYAFSADFCCYKIIQRVQQSHTNYDKEADKIISYSECTPVVAERTEIPAHFIMIECSWPTRLNVIYRSFHATTFINSSSTLKKMSHWKKSKDERESQNADSRPPNILIIEQDSTSRLNFRRNMPKTLKILEELGATEMTGFIKVGENTFPNFCPILMGYSGDDIQKICFPSSLEKIDDCPLIWKRFAEANYLTGFIEDSPILSMFNYLKTGFVKQPVDFYGRPLWLATHDYGHFLHLVRAEHMDCVGYLTNDEMILKYVETTLEISNSSKTPFFTLSSSTTVSHDDPNAIQVVDDSYAEFLQRIIAKGYLDNTILMFMGDHGYRFGALRETLIGFYEDKLPNLWIKLPPSLQQQFPEWQRTLEINSKRLTTPFTLYWTLNHILSTFTPIRPPQDEFVSNTQTTVPRRYRQSFFDEIPENMTCRDAGVPDEYCPCYTLKEMNTSDINHDLPMLTLAAEEALTFINSKTLLGTSCVPLKVEEVTSGAVLHKDQRVDGVRRFIVGFVTNPGAFAIEAEIDFSIEDTKWISVPSVHRANKINKKHVHCTSESEVELFCFCS